jgi:hypothetical protein
MCMTGLFLDLTDRTQVLDFIEDTKEYLPVTTLKRVDKVLADSDFGLDLSEEELADLAKMVGRKSWAPRRALRRHLEAQDGCDEEWRLVVAAVSDSTAHIMERFRHGTTCTSLDLVLKHEESGSAFRDVERFEIEQVRRHVRQVIWREKRHAIAAEEKRDEALLETIVERLETLRQLAADTPWIQDEVLAKIRRFEDKLYFEGDILVPERLDEEIKFYREEKEIPPEG